MRILVAGWFSFPNGHATAGDLLAKDVVCGWLTDANCRYDVALATPFAGGVDVMTVAPADYSHVVFVCGPFAREELEAELLKRFAACRLIGLDLSMSEPLDAWNPFDFLLERDSSVTARPDLVFLSRAPRVPVVGVCLVEAHAGAATSEAHGAIQRLVASREVATVNIDTRLDANETQLRTPAEVESLIARVDLLITTRLHGLVLALKNGVPVIAIDAIPGGAKIRRQAEVIGWRTVFQVDELSDAELQRAFDYCLTDDARLEARACAERATRALDEARGQFLGALNGIGGGIEDAFRDRIAKATRAAARPAPTVSVIVMTYNHERFIAQALDSVLMQETSFDYEVIVSEDLSTDRTREIVREYQRRNPERVRPIFSERNLHSNQVVVRGFEAARGKYIALLDGDDYWTSPHKLTKQVEFLERHPECSMCFHNAMVVDESGRRPPRPWTPAHHREISTLGDIWRGNFIATCSAMFRNGVIGTVPEWYIPLFPITDWPLHILHAEHGNIGYIDEMMGVYRHHEGGLYSSRSEQEKHEATAEFYEIMNRNLEGRHEAMIRPALFRYFFEWAQEYARRGEVERARSYLWRSVRGSPAYSIQRAPEVARLWLRLRSRRMATGRVA